MNKTKYNCSTLQNAKEYLDLMIDVFTRISFFHCQKGEKSEALADAKLSFQMIYIKAMTARKMLDGVSYDGAFIKLNNVIDFSSLFSLVRDIYEQLCVFELIYILPDSKEKSEMMYLLFQIQGLSERQKFDVMEENKHICDEEKEELDKYKDAVQNLELYKNATAQIRLKYDNAMNNGKFRYIIQDNGDLTFVEYDAIKDYIGIKETHKDLYRFLSLHSHPSSVAMRQFAVGFEHENPACFGMGKTACMFILSFMSIFFADFCRLFPEVKLLFNVLAMEERDAVAMYNRLLRKDFTL